MQSGSFSARNLALTAVMAAVLCVLAPWSVNVGPIPLSLATLGVYLCVYLLGWKWGTVSVLVYLLLGAAGMPVFSSFSGGLGKLFGPTGGYLIGYLALAILTGLAVDHSSLRPVHFAGMVAGTVALYALGTAWYCFQSGTALGVALSKCVWIFIPGDLLKMAAALVLGPLLRRRLGLARLQAG
jgi:biotin transport system substrate-specific component